MKVEMNQKAPKAESLDRVQMKDLSNEEFYAEMVKQKDATGVRVVYRMADGSGFIYMNPGWTVPEFVNADSIIRFDKLSKACVAFLRGKQPGKKKGRKK